MISVQFDLSDCGLRQGFAFSLMEIMESVNSDGISTHKWMLSTCTLAGELRDDTEGF